MCRKYFKLKREIDDTISKNVRNSYRLKQEIDDTAVKDKRKILD